MTFDAERVRQRQGDLAAGRLRQLHRLVGKGGALGDIVDVSLDQDDARRTHGMLGHVAYRQLRASAEVGLHRPLAILFDQYIAPRRRSALCRSFESNVDAESTHVMVEDFSELVVAHASDVSGCAAKRCEAGHGIGDRSAGHLGGGPHGCVNLVGPILVDQCH